jgi:hypothetical protein
MQVAFFVVGRLPGRLRLLLSLLSHAGMVLGARCCPRALRFKRLLHRRKAWDPIASRRRS